MFRRSGTRAPQPRRTSYRDPDLSDRWLAEAEATARGRGPALTQHDARKIILRLVAEVRRINRETNR